MFIVLGLVFLTAFCIGFGLWWGNSKTYRDVEGWRIASFFLALALVITLIAIPYSRLDTHSEIIELEAVRDTLERARANDTISPYEIAAMQQKATEMNQWLANAQFWAKHPLTNWFWPKDVFNVQPIR